MQPGRLAAVNSVPPAPAAAAQLAMAATGSVAQWPCRQCMAYWYSRTRPDQPLRVMANPCGAPIVSARLACQYSGRLGSLSGGTGAGAVDATTDRPASVAAAWARPRSPIAVATP